MSVWAEHAGCSDFPSDNKLWLGTALFLTCIQGDSGALSLGPENCDPAFKVLLKPLRLSLKSLYYVTASSSKPPLERSQKNKTLKKSLQTSGKDTLTITSLAAAVKFQNQSLGLNQNRMVQPKQLMGKLFEKKRNQFLPDHFCMMQKIKIKNNCNVT